MAPTLKGRGYIDGKVGLQKMVKVGSTLVGRPGLHAPRNNKTGASASGTIGADAPTYP